MKNRLREVRKKQGLTLKELSQQLKNIGFNISPDTLGKYERAEREPKLETWQKLADYFNASVTYLLGYDDISTPDALSFASKRDAISCIEKIMKTLDISKEDLEESINDKNKTIYRA